MLSHALPKTGPEAKRAFRLLFGLTLAIYLGMWVFYSLPDLTRIRALREVVTWLVTLGLLFSYWQGYRIAQTGLLPTRWLAVSGLALGLAALQIPMFHSTDLYGYINRGWQQWHYGVNPYVATVSDIPGWQTDPMLTDHWIDNPSPYGFLYLLIAQMLAALGGGQLAATVAVFKGFNLLLHLGVATLLWIGVRLLRIRGGSMWNPSMAVYLYLWNPLILVHTLANGHNDIYMAFFIVLAAVLAIGGARLWVLPALMAATLIKYGAVVILPFAAVYLWRQKDRNALLGGTALASLVFIVTGWPFLADWPSFHLAEIGRNAQVSHGSLHALLYDAYKSLAQALIPVLYEHREIMRAVLKYVLLLAYAVLYGGLLWRRFRQRGYTLAQWIWDALLVMAVLVCLVSPKFYPWYLGMFFPLALLLPPGDTLRRVVIVLSGAQLFGITAIGQADMLNFIAMTALPVLWALRRARGRGF